MSETQKTATEGENRDPLYKANPKDDTTISSGALYINLQRTAFPGYIQPDQKLLLDIIGDRVGIRKETESLLHEVNHPYANWDEIVEPLRSRALGDFYYYNEHHRAPDAFSIFFRLLFMCLEKSSPGARKTRCFSTFFDFAELVLLKNPSGGVIVNQAFSGLKERLADKPAFAARGTSKIRKFIERVMAASVSFDPEVLAGLYLFCQRRNIEVWLSRESLEAWLHREKDRLLGGKDYRDQLKPLSPARFRKLLRELAALEKELQDDPFSSLRRSLSLPDFASIEREHLKVARDMEDPSIPLSSMDKTRFLLHLLEIEALSDQNETILRELGHCFENIRSQDEILLIEFLKDVMDSLREKSGRYRNAVLDSVLTIGREVYMTGNSQLVETFIDSVIRLGFEPPDIQGVTRDWQVMANPLHMKNLRVWLSLIRMNPDWSHRLISALIIHLKLGGLFVTDTNLFQKDISLLLAADVSSSYALVKALARLFPVYFHEIGAEGELRDVSTEVDEISGRKDLLIHFLRKQSHVESNNRIVDFVGKIIEYWHDGDREILRDHLPEEVYDRIMKDDPFREEMAPLFKRIFSGDGARVGCLSALSDNEVRELVRGSEDVPDRIGRKAELLIRLYRLLVKKYTIQHHGIMKDLRESHLFDPYILDELENRLKKQNLEGSLELINDLLSRLKDTVLSSEKTKPREEIYRKRHIAAGIPSMYGRYGEKKFDSMALTFRLESLADGLFDEITAGVNLTFITHTTLRKVHGILRYFMGSLRLDGIAVEAAAANLDMLRHALESRRITVDQYLNIFQFIAKAVKEIIQTQYIGVHEGNLRPVIFQLIENKTPLPFTPSPGSTREEIYHQASEWFIRDHLATRFLIQKLDNFIGRVIAGLAKESQSLDRNTRTLLLSYNPERCFVSLDSTNTLMDTQIYLGNKGYFLKCLRSFGYPVPPGFIVTTEFFRCRSAIMAYDAAASDYYRRLREEILRLERASGRKFGDPNRPLLLSVRSGSTITMPGMMETFLNIGINEEIVERMVSEPWAAWDNYRRFLQRFGMSYGIPRDRFDAIMSRTKRAHNAAFKRELLPEQLKELVYAYKGLLEEASLQLPTNPWEQLQIAIDRVLDSWQSETASLYREAMNIAGEWGTAVIVQQMVFGNRNTGSGTGVVFTRNPKKPDSRVTLYGDYMVCIQGEDVVSGLVTTHPISEEQRIAEKIEGDQSLEKSFPHVYHRLKELADELVTRRGFSHQEIEFTFEGPNPEDLYILQTRDMTPPEDENLRIFVPTPSLKKGLAGTGIAVGGGALSGIAVHRVEEVDDLRRRHPGVPLIMIKPDTVPEDIDMVLKVDGVLTARGGSTSHAAVAAYRLGKTCVVGCQQLVVNEEESKSRLREHVIRSGDWIGLDGRNGFIYLGRHETMPFHETQH
ncbi:MAG: PEP-utilizing enzyme [Syntrophales bacterium]|nr:PEP-utilizing enzyme [Syntrophales bacterium]MCK9528028.1 PEP-utilizing enzyme [Syntrophales bacterium]MDX9921395.1 PEP/pyruvate-binding domain-containing protein [Syntrophales bacterium]